MPVRLDGTTSDFITIAAASFPSVTAYTITFWMQVVNANAGANRTFYACNDNGTNEQRIWRPASNNDAFAKNYVSDSDLSSNDDETSWHMWALTSSGTSAGNGNVYRWKLGDPDGTYGTMSFTPNSFTPNQVYIGGTYYSVGRDARFCFVKLWDAALSLSELQAERVSGKPQRLTNVNRYHRLDTATDTTDYSGNARSCAIDGAVTEGTEPVNWETLSTPQFFQYNWPHQLHARR
jgi:hypothetical protein